SADGRRVAFDSGAQNLVADDTNTTWDVFVHDRMTGETSRANVDSSGRQANGYSGFEGLAISGDGRLVAFVSEATNLVWRATNRAEDVFLHELDGEGDAVTLASALPGSGSLSGGDRVNLDGSGFTDRADTTVTFGGLRAAVLEVSPSRIVVTSPRGAAAGAVDVSVSNCVGFATLTAGYTYVDPAIAARFGDVNVGR